MIKSFILSLLILFGIKTSAQTGVAEDINTKIKTANPEAVAHFEDKLEHDIKQYLHNSHNYNALAKTTGDDTTGYDLPMVFHVIHDYGAGDYVPDTAIYNAVAMLNSYFLKQNADTANVIAPYSGFIPGTNKRYIGNAKIHFHLATKDPQGNPTHGIVRHRSYLTHNGGDQAKLDQWPQDKYYNVWLIEKFGPDDAGADAYTFMPPTAATFPYMYTDGTIMLSIYIQSNYDLKHQSGNYLGLYYLNTDEAPPCNNYNQADDTPPAAVGHTTGFCSPPGIFALSCAAPYSKNYAAGDAFNLFGDSTFTFIDYPDTVNQQNIMASGGCPLMFTYGQTQRMRGTLHSVVANRNNLVSPQNIASTGATAPFPDLPPIPDFSFGKTSTILGSGDRVLTDKVYGCADVIFKVQLTDRSWNDTIISREWSFSNGASTPSSTAAVVSTSFTQPGWVAVTLNATGNNTGTATKTSSNAIYIASDTGMDPHGYFEGFVPANGTSDKWPMFNYYSNNWKWEITDAAGFYDHYCIRYKNYDQRISDPSPYPARLTGTPKGDFDDLFSPPFDLSGSEYITNCNLNFMYAGAFITDIDSNRNDTLEILYSTTCGNSWALLSTLSKDKLANNSSTSQEFVPANMSQWALQSIPIPAAAKTAKTMFRFRYKPGAFLTTSVSSLFYLLGSGNDFYIDHFHISSFPTGVDETVFAQNNMVLAPNPTAGKTSVMINGGTGIAELHITDITGKLVYTISQPLSDKITVIEIPAEVIQAKGIYLVHMRINDRLHTEKLVVY